MNKLLTYAGIQPIYLGDIDFTQNAVSDALKNIAKALVNLSSDTPDAILQGVEITRPTSGTLAWSAGVVVLSGEILPIAAGTITADDPSDLYFHVVSVLSGARTFKDGVSRQCYDTRSATLTTESTDGVQLTSLVKLHEIDYAEYSPVSLPAGVSAAKLAYKKGFWGVDISVSSIGTYTLLFNIDTELLSKLPDTFSYYTTMDLYQTSAWVVEPVRVNLIKADSTYNLMVQLLFLGDSVSGSGRFLDFIPIF